MEEKKGETASKKNPKKANLLDHHSIKHILDESVIEIVTSKGYPEDVRLSNIRLLLGAIIIVIALFAQFYNKKFPENRIFLLVCIASYSPPGSITSTGLIVTSKLPRFSDSYTLIIASADPSSISAKPPVELTKRVTQWFTGEGVLLEGCFWKDVEGLINDYAKKSKKSK
ncbi:hypothetical protein OROGR_025661 [Orobanche gracilis]